ncbi:MAG: hypothetical protein O2780_04270 [Proteobacteria bacterium]|nr:hypothetical protein [Pseudomonadota bacterium]
MDGIHDLGGRQRLAGQIANRRASLARWWEASESGLKARSLGHDH